MHYSIGNMINMTHRDSPLKIILTCDSKVSNGATAVVSC